MTSNRLLSWVTRSATSQRPMWLAGTVCVIGLGTWTAWQFRGTPEIQVTTAPVDVGRIVRRVNATGTVKAVTTVEVGVQISGTIQSLEADYNSIVHAGQVLARLDPALFEAALRESEAALLQKQAALAQAHAEKLGSETLVDDARTKLQRAEELAVKQLLPQSDLDVARVAMQVASADLQAAESEVGEATAAAEQAKAAVDQAKVNLDHTVIFSPIDGIVIARNVDVGQTVAATIQAPVLFNIATDLKHVQLEVYIDESDIGGVHAGEPAVFEVESYPDKPFSGNVSQVRFQPIAEQTTTATTVGTSTVAPVTTDIASVISYPAIVDVANPDESLRPGMTATVTLNGSRRENVLRAPNKALSFRPPPDVVEAPGMKADTEPAMGADVRQVWQYDGSRFTAIAVRTGLSDGHWTEILSGPLRPGDGLVTSASLAPRSR